MLSRSVHDKYLLLFKVLTCSLVVALGLYSWIIPASRKPIFPASYNINTLSFIIESKICDNSAPYLINIVPSHPNHVNSRMILRKAYNQLFPQGSVKVVFIFGNVSDTLQQDQISEEADLHGDILQGNYIDEYRSLTFMHLTGLKWVSASCSRAKFVMESDDDIFVNIKQLLDKIEKLGNGTYMYCDLISQAYPFRNPKEKYYVSEAEYPTKYYPTYCNGWSVVYPMNVAHKLIAASKNVPYLWMSDVYMSGMLPTNISGFQYISMRPNYTWEDSDLKSWMNEAPNETGRYLVGPTWGDIDLLKKLHVMVGTFS